jgi:hypothetical protein
LLITFWSASDWRQAVAEHTTEGKGDSPSTRLEIDVQEGVFLLQVWHEGGRGDVWRWSITRVMPDDTIHGYGVPGINVIARKIDEGRG